MEVSGRSRKVTSEGVWRTSQRNTSTRRKAEVCERKSQNSSSVTCLGHQQMLQQPRPTSPCRLQPHRMLSASHCRKYSMTFTTPLEIHSNPVEALRALEIQAAPPFRTTAVPFLPHWEMCHSTMVHKIPQRPLQRYPTPNSRPSLLLWWPIQPSRTIWRYSKDWGRLATALGPHLPLAPLSVPSMVLGRRSALAAQLRQTVAHPPVLLDQPQP